MADLLNSITSPDDWTRQICLVQSSGEAIELGRSAMLKFYAFTPCVLRFSMTYIVLRWHIMIMILTMMSGLIAIYADDDDVMPNDGCRLRGSFFVAHSRFVSCVRVGRCSRPKPMLPRHLPRDASEASNDRGGRTRSTLQNSRGGTRRRHAVRLEVPLSLEGVQPMD